eukprot:5309818-Prymnesium_polylepis.1
MKPAIPPAPAPARTTTRIGRYLWCNQRRCLPSAQLRDAKGFGCLECEGCESGCGPVDGAGGAK